MGIGLVVVCPGGVLVSGGGGPGEGAVGVGLDPPAGGRCLSAGRPACAVAAQVLFAAGAAVGRGGDVVEFGVGGLFLGSRAWRDVAGRTWSGRVGGWVVGGAGCSRAGCRQWFFGHQAAPHPVGGDLAGQRRRGSGRGRPARRAGRRRRSGSSSAITIWISGLPGVTGWIGRPAPAPAGSPPPARRRRRVVAVAGSSPWRRSSAAVSVSGLVTRRPLSRAARMSARRVSMLPGVVGAQAASQPGQPGERPHRIGRGEHRPQRAHPIRLRGDHHPPIPPRLPMPLLRPLRVGRQHRPRQRRLQLRQRQLRRLRQHRGLDFAGVLVGTAPPWRRR